MIITVFGVGVVAVVTPGVLGLDDGLSVGEMLLASSLTHLRNVRKDDFAQRAGYTVALCCGRYARVWVQYKLPS